MGPEGYFQGSGAQYGGDNMHGTQDMTGSYPMQGAEMSQQYHDGHGSMRYDGGNYRDNNRGRRQHGGGHRKNDWRRHQNDQSESDGYHKTSETLVHFHKSFGVMQEIFDHRDFSTLGEELLNCAANAAPYGTLPSPQFLDLGCAPGGFSAALLQDHMLGPNSIGFGVSLPPQMGGFSMAFASERLYVYLEDMLTLEKHDLMCQDNSVVLASADAQNLANMSAKRQDNKVQYRGVRAKSKTLGIWALTVKECSLAFAKLMSGGAFIFRFGWRGVSGEDPNLHPTGEEVHPALLAKYLEEEEWYKSLTHWLFSVLKSLFKTMRPFKSEYVHQADVSFYMVCREFDRSKFDEHKWEAKLARAFVELSTCEDENALIQGISEGISAEAKAEIDSLLEYVGRMRAIGIQSRRVTQPGSLDGWGGSKSSDKPTEKKSSESAEQKSEKKPSESAEQKSEESKPEEKPEEKPDEKPDKKLETSEKADTKQKLDKLEEQPVKTSTVEARWVPKSTQNQSDASTTAEEGGSVSSSSTPHPEKDTKDSSETGAGSKTERPELSTTTAASLNSGSTSIPVPPPPPPAPKQREWNRYDQDNNGGYEGGRRNFGRAMADIGGKSGRDNGYGKGGDGKSRKEFGHFQQSWPSRAPAPMPAPMPPMQPWCGPESFSQPAVIMPQQGIVYGQGEAQMMDASQPQMMPGRPHYDQQMYPGQMHADQMHPQSQQFDEDYPWQTEPTQHQQTHDWNGVDGGFQHGTVYYAAEGVNAAAMNTIPEVSTGQMTWVQPSTGAWVPPPPPVNPPNINLSDVPQVATAPVPAGVPLVPEDAHTPAVSSTAPATSIVDEPSLGAAAKATLAAPPGTFSGASLADLQAPSDSTASTSGATAGKGAGGRGSGQRRDGRDRDRERSKTAQANDSDSESSSDEDGKRHRHKRRAGKSVRERRSQKSTTTAPRPDDAATERLLRKIARRNEKADQAAAAQPPVAKTFTEAVMLEIRQGDFILHATRFGLFCAMAWSMNSIIFSLLRLLKDGESSEPSGS